MTHFTDLLQKGMESIKQHQKDTVTEFFWKEIMSSPTEWAIQEDLPRLPFTVEDTFELKADAPPHDTLWFTSPIEEADHAEDLASQLWEDTFELKDARRIFEAVECLNECAKIMRSLHTDKAVLTAQIEELEKRLGERQSLEVARLLLQIEELEKRLGER